MHSNYWRFALGDRKFLELECQELGFYYDAELSKPLRFNESEIVHRSRDGSSDLEFRWALPTAATLVTFDLKPMPLIGLIEKMPVGATHLVHKDCG